MAKKARGDNVRKARVNAAANTVPVQDREPLDPNNLAVPGAVYGGMEVADKLTPDKKGGGCGCWSN